jgi:hypothetical protein
MLIGFRAFVGGVVQLALKNLLPPKSEMKPLVPRAVVKVGLKGFGLAVLCSVPIVVMPANAQLLEVPFGGLKQGSRDVQILEFSKSASAVSSGIGTGVAADANADLSLTTGAISGSAAVLSPAGVIKSELSATGFTTDGMTELGTGQISVSTNLPAGQGVEGQLVGGSAATQFSLVRNVSSASPAFVNAFASQFR